MTTTIILIRHGETNKNASEKIHLVNDPEPLNELGRKQIQKTAEKLLGRKLHKIYSSLEPRAIESAKIVASLNKIDHQSHKNLGERNWGVHQSKFWLEIKEILDHMSIEKRHKWIPKGGESWEQFEKKLTRAVHEIIKDNEGKTVVVVTHGGSLRAMMPTFLNIPKEKRFDYFFSNASISEFEFDGKNFKEVKINDTSHLG